MPKKILYTLHIVVTELWNVFWDEGGGMSPPSSQSDPLTITWMEDQAAPETITLRRLPDGVGWEIDS